MEAAIGPDQAGWLVSMLGWLSGSRGVLVVRYWTLVVHCWLSGSRGALVVPYWLAVRGTPGADLGLVVTLRIPTDTQVGRRPCW